MAEPVLGVRVRAVASELREGARVVLDPRFEPPHATSAVQRLAHGAALPFKVLRALWRDRAARAEYLRVLAIELAVVVPVSLFFATQSDDVADAAGVGWRAWMGETVAFAGALYVIASVVEWIAIWLAREYHDDLAFRAAKLTGVPGEALAERPRIRMDLGFLWLKARRKLRALILFGVGIPFFAVVLLVPGIGAVLYAALLGLWAAYWASVFAIANTHLAWEREGKAGAPWFVRGLERMRLLPVVGLPAIVLLPITRRATHSVYAACEAFEEAPWESLGLALARAIIGQPFVWLAVRPVFGPAATHALVGARLVAPGLRSTSEPPAPTRSSAPPGAPPRRSP